MIRPDKIGNALYALNAVFFIARNMAYEKEPHQKIATVLDYAEMLPRFIASREDHTEDFRTYLEEMAIVYPLFNVALGRFDIDDAPTEF